MGTKDSSLLVRYFLLVCRKFVEKLILQTIREHNARKCIRSFKYYNLFEINFLKLKASKLHPGKLTLKINIFLIFIFDFLVLELWLVLWSFADRSF